jgi:hypothetical protein
LTPEELSRLTPEEKRELLRRLLAERAAVGSGDYPLAHSQRALWFLQRLLPDTCAYNVAFAVRAQPPLDIEKLHEALDHLVARHPALRTIFPEKDGQPIQRVLPVAKARLHVIEAADLSDAELLAVVRTDYQRPFCLDEPLASVTLYRRDDEDVMLINVHHLVFDAWSLQVLFADLRALYEAELNGVKSTLPPIAAQYRDFVAWQGDLLDEARGQELFSYWEGALAGEIQPLEIPSSQIRPPTLALRGTHEPFSLSPELSSSLHALARSHSTTLYSVFLAAMQVMLYQFSGKTDITIGTPVSLRTRSEWANVIGYFINMLPMRGKVDDAEAFSAHLARTREMVLGALSHQEFPFSLMVDRFKIRRDLNRSPVFQAMLNVNVSPRTSELSRLFTAGQQEAVNFGTSYLTSYMMPQQEGQFEIVIEVTDSNGVLNGNLKYQTDLYSADTAKRMLTAFRSILETIVVDPDTRIEDMINPERDTFEV